MFRRGCVSLRGGARAESTHCAAGMAELAAEFRREGRTAEAAATARATVDAWFEAAAASALGETLPKTITKKQIATPPGIELPVRARGALGLGGRARVVSARRFAKGGVGGGDDGAVADADAALAAGLVRALAAKGGEGSMTRAKELVGGGGGGVSRDGDGSRSRAARGDVRGAGAMTRDERIERSRFGSAARLKAWRDRAGC